MGSRTLGGGGAQSLASMVRALVSKSQDSMRSLLSAGIRSTRLTAVIFTEIGGKFGDAFDGWGGQVDITIVEFIVKNSEIQF